MSPGAGELAIGGGGRKADPFVELYRAARGEPQDLIPEIDQTVLQKCGTVERIMISRRPVEHQVRRVPKGIVPVTPEDITPRHAIKTVVEIIDFEEDAVAHREDGFFLVNDIIAWSQAGLQLVVDHQGYAMVVGRKTPIIKMPEGLVQAKVERRRDIVIGQHPVLLPIDPVITKVGFRALFEHTEFQAIGQHERVQ